MKVIIFWMKYRFVALKGGPFRRWIDCRAWTWARHRTCFFFCFLKSLEHDFQKKWQVFSRVRPTFVAKFSRIRAVKVKLGWLCGSALEYFPFFWLRKKLKIVCLKSGREKISFVEISQISNFNDRNSYNFSQNWKVIIITCLISPPLLSRNSSRKQKTLRYYGFKASWHLRQIFCMSRNGFDSKVLGSYKERL